MLMRSPLARERRRPAGFIKPCQPTLSDKAPSGPQWLHEIKHDGYRIIACKSGDQVRLWSRNGRDWSREFLAVTEALRPSGSRRSFSTARRWRTARTACPTSTAFARRTAGLRPACSPSTCCGSTARICGRCRLRSAGRRLRKALRGAGKALRFSEHLEGDGEAIFRHACALGLEGIVSKRRDARYRSGRSLTWLKVKNPTYERR